MTSARDQLRSIYDRWSRLEADKAAVAEDLKGLFAEAKGNGYEPKALRIAFRTKAKSEEETAADLDLAALVDVYLSALGTDNAITRASRARNPAEAPPVASAGHSAPAADGRIVSAPAGRAAEESPATSSSTAIGGAHVATTDNRTPETGGGSKRTTPADLPAWAAPPIPDYLVRAG